MQIANIRFHLNGWHTGRRYQNRDKTHCLFCKDKDADDSIEHFVHCPAIQSLFPQHMKQGPRSRVPVSSFFLRQLDGRHRLTFALLVYALYAVHNDFRNSTNHQDFARCVFHNLAEAKVRREICTAAAEILDIQL